jgi:hypothetical protein
MKRLMIAGFAGLGLLAAATTILWSHAPSTARSFASDNHPSQVAVDTKKLPIEEFEDMSLVYSATAKR